MIPKKPVNKLEVVSDENSEQEPFITPEMIERNPTLAATGLFADEPFADFWQEVREEIERNREQQRQEDALLDDAEFLARYG